MNPDRLASLLLASLLLAPMQALAVDWPAIADRLNTLRLENDVPAMGMVIVDEHRPVLIRTFGNAATTTPFRWGSITKSFTALAALQLVATEEALDLDSPIRPILGPGYYRNDWAPGRPVRLIELLELSAGLAELSGTEFNDNQPRPLWEALERNATGRATLWPPGLQHSYSNVPPGLTAAVIEKISGQTFEKYAAEKVLRPLNMQDASFAPMDDLPGGFGADGRTPIPYWHMTFRSFGALNASIEEMAGFVTAMLNDGRLDAVQVLSEASIRQFFTPSSTLGVQAGLEVSYAAGSYGWVRGGHVFWGHGGDADGYLSRYGLLREHGRGYLLVINTDNPKLFGALRRMLEDALSEDLQVHPPPAGSSDSQDLARFTGSYYPTSSRFGRERWQRGEAGRARVRQDDAALIFERGQRRVRLLPLGGGRFIRPGDPAVTVVFTEDQHGSLQLQGELGNFVNLSSGSCPGFIDHCE